MNPLKKHRVLNRRTIYQGKIIDLVVDDIQIDGKEYIREVVRHPGGVVILAQLPDGTIPFVKQHRYPMDEILLELPAGKLDPGEDPARAAGREFEEETGYRAIGLERFLAGYTSPGFCDELLHFFYADRTQPGTVDREEDEIMQVERLSLEEALALADQGKIVDVKTLLALYWLDARRTRFASPEA